MSKTLPALDLICVILGSIIIMMILLPPSLLPPSSSPNPVAIEPAKNVLGREVQASFFADVIRVIDGDTIDLAGHPVNFRFASIDAPEKKQPFGKAATDALQYLVGQTVQVHQVDIDRWKRPVVFLVLSDGTNVNAKMVEDGLAWHAVKYSDDVTLERLESEAKIHRRGLWGQDPEPVAPWVWRKK